MREDFKILTKEVIPSTPELEVNYAHPNDIDEILHTQSEKLIIPEEVDEKEAASKGFLVYPISAEELEDLITHPEEALIKVAKKDGELAGYIISYDRDRWEIAHPTWTNDVIDGENEQGEWKDNKVMYGRHIAVKDQIKSSGVGKELLTSTLKDAKDKGYEYYVVEVLKEPITNTTSAKFVEKLGFRLVGESRDQHNRQWFVYLKDLTI